MTLENGNGEELGEEIAEELAEEIIEELEEPDLDIEVEVVEIPEVPEVATVNVGDLSISGPPDMVKAITSKYLDDHLDHNPHELEHTLEEPAAVIEEQTDTIGEAITPDIVEEQIQESVQDETSDVAPGPASWLYRPLGGS